MKFKLSFSSTATIKITREREKKKKNPRTDTLKQIIRHNQTPLFLCRFPEFSADTKSAVKCANYICIFVKRTFHADFN